MSKGNKGSPPAYPKKPMTAYLRFISEDCAELKGQQNYRDKVKEKW